ncbi:MAG TPA: hypothetical protein VLT91_05645 [Rhizomicrobium sp.]|nr:hypothetical protein [Rhizomicrobium sp.]
MRGKIVAVIMVVCGLGAALPARAESVHEYLAKCPKYVPSSDECLGPIANAIAWDMASGSHITACISSESDADQEQLFVAVRAWLKAHPELDSDQSNDAALKAMNGLYHCRRGRTAS